MDCCEDKLGLWDIGVPDRMLVPRVRTDRGDVGERGGSRGEGEAKAAGGREGWGLGRAVGILAAREVRA